MLVDDILDDIEILLINDGSKDNTLEILHQYEAKYPSIIRVINKENGGWGTAINLGIREANGKYLKEVDADDCTVIGCHLFVNLATGKCVAFFV